MRSIYVIGSLRNPEIAQVSAALRQLNLDVFDDWHAAGPTADDEWLRYEKERGHTYHEALSGYAAQHVFQFDKKHLDRCDAGVLVMPAGKSGHLEIGYMLGKGKLGYILFDQEPERWDVMYQFASGVFFSREEFLEVMSVKAAA